MAYQVLARKCRPKQFEAVIGQSHITRALQNSLKQKTLAHAYLFTGTRGVGKTSIARLFAKAIRCENPKNDFNPCMVCSSCQEIESGQSLDYLEIDGASHNKVDDVRAIIENVHFMPSSGSFKIYVIDEVHMLSDSAFNALLKTLEEPPSHVIFILATTDAQKLLTTVLSRVQRFDFRPVPASILRDHALMIAKEENIKFENNLIVEQLAELGSGSVRDMLSIWDQILSLAPDKNITGKIFYEVLGLVSAQEMKKLISGIISCQSESVLLIFNKCLNQNIDLKKLSQQILNSFYKIIQSLDTKESVEDIVDSKLLAQMSFSELFWIYESFLKDSTWALKAPLSHQVFSLIFQKLCWRRKEFSVQSINSIDEKKNEKLDNVRLEIPTKTSKEFLISLESISPSIKSHLDQGAFTKEPQFLGDKFLVDYGFESDKNISKEFLLDRDINLKLIKLIAEFFNIEEQKIQLNIHNITKEMVKETGFSSYIDQESANQEEIKKQKKERILNDPVIQEAQKIFNSKIDKVIIKE
jgi:DNA polymerase-3 subunit gamma/tau